MPADPQYEVIHPKTENIKLNGCHSRPRLKTGDTMKDGSIFIFSDTCRHNESDKDPLCVGCPYVGEGKAYSDTLQILNSGLSKELMKFLLDTVEAFPPNDVFHIEDPRVIELKKKNLVARVFLNKNHYVGLSEQGFEFYIKLRTSPLYEEIKNGV